MKAIILLNYNENTRQIEDEEKSRFLKTLLDQMGVPIDDIWVDDSLSIEQKIKLRNVLTMYSIKILDDLDGHMQVYVENELVGEWNKCTYKLKKDKAEIDRKKQLYLEMEISCWTVFEQNENLNE